VRVYLVRHATAEAGEPDALRPLAPKGRRQARELGKRFAGEGLDAVVSSPLLRARETAAAIAKAVGADAATDERLAPGATAADLRSAVANRGERVVAVAHQPDCSKIVAALTGREQDFPPAGVCELDL
jgi:phosphohistidine phosphatase SixA